MDGNKLILKYSFRNLDVHIYSLKDLSDATLNNCIECCLKKYFYNLLNLNEFPYNYQEYIYNILKKMKDFHLKVRNCMSCFKKLVLLRDIY